MEQEEGLVYDWLICTCLAIPEFEILWGIGEYVVFLPEYLIELYFPFALLGDIQEIDLHYEWMYLMHLTFCGKNGSNYLEGPVTHGGLRSCFQTILKWLNATIEACWLLAKGGRCLAQLISSDCLTK